MVSAMSTCTSMYALYSLTLSERPAAVLGQVVEGAGTLEHGGEAEHPVPQAAPRRLHGYHFHKLHDTKPAQRRCI